MAQTQRLPARTTLAYGLGAAAYGIKDSGFATFLLLFYNQVMGLPAGTVGLVIMCALLLDALVDPAIGALSDRTRGRWGRRHPWMYAAALPIGLGWLALWNPPVLSQSLTLVWLFVTAVVVRTAVSAYEVPSQALTPELTSDYDERTRITAYRYLFGWAGGLTMLMLAYQVFLVPGPGQPNGLLRAAGYQHMALLAAGLMVVAILVSAIGTHDRIATLPKRRIERIGVGEHFRQLGQTLRNRGFAILMLTGLCAYTAQGISFALSNYFYSYVWNLGPAALAMLPLALFAGVVIAFVVAPRLGARFGKPTTGAVAALGTGVLLTSPYLLRLLGVYPPPGDALLVPLLLGTFTIQTAFSVTSFITGASMMADIVEDSEMRTGRRSEGVFFAGSFFVQKCTSGIGIFAAGLILAIAEFPEAAKPGQVPMATVDRLTLIFAVTYLALSLAVAFFYTRFPFGRAEHEGRLAALAADRAGRAG